LHKQALIPLGVPGFHSMRRWRVSYLKMIGTPESLLKAWIGYANGNDITARYDKSVDDTEWRQTWANRCGVGFDVPEIGAAAPAPSASKPGRRILAPKVSEPPQPQPTYIAEDNDLDDVLYSAPEVATLTSSAHSESPSPRPSS
jgi:hypothetical protein